MSQHSAPPCVVVMGVSGSGKSTVGRLLAAQLAVPYEEGDDLHPPRNVALMAAGTPLTDADRQGWLDSIAQVLARAGAQGRGVVVSCSALKRSYRDLLRRAAPGLQLLHLAGSRAVLEQRLLGRSGHYMPVSLLQSQLQTLQPPDADEAAITLDIGAPAEAIVALALQQLQQLQQLHGAAASCGPVAATHEQGRMDAPSFTKVILYTGADGRAAFRDEAVPLGEGKPQARLSAVSPASGMQLRHSPVGFRSDFHCTEHPQWLFVLGGQMEIGLQDGSTRVFGPGQHFYSADLLPVGATFDPAVHGHCSRQLGSEPLVTLFVRA